MEYRRFGKTGLTVSVFTLGTMRFPRGWDHPPEEYPDESLEAVHAILQTATRAGITLIETARGYVKSEGLIGKVLPTLPPGVREQLHVMTKASPASARETRRNLEDSLRRLGLDRVPLFAVHGINTPQRQHETFRPGGALDGLLKARQEGLIGAIGFSTHASPAVVRDLLATRVFDFVNLHYYAFRRDHRQTLALARELDLGVLIISPNDKGGRLYEPSPGLKSLTAPMHPVHYNERWLLAQPEVSTLSLGLSQADQLAVHLGSLEKGPELAEVEARLHRAAAGSPLIDCGPCSACLPCPRGIEIAEVLRLAHLEQAFDMGLYARYRYGAMRPGDDWIPGAAVELCDQCGDCLPRCPRALEIPGLLAAFGQRMQQG